MEQSEESEEHRPHESTLNHADASDMSVPRSLNYRVPSENDVGEYADA